MSLREFLFAADALRQEEGIGFHVETETGRPLPPAPLPSPADNRARNAQAMQMLTGMMAGVQKKKGGHRR